MSRKLVTIRKISALIPMDGYDAVCLAAIDGWTTIVKKSEFTVGSYCVFFELDSFIPATDTRFAFLKKTTKFEGQEGYRLRSMKLRSYLSQGLALPTWFLGLSNALVEQWYKDQTDISSEFGVIKYDNSLQELDQRPGLKSGKPRGSFPSFIPKTDQERIQNLTHLWNTLDPETTFEETLKLDGCFLADQYIETWEGNSVKIKDIVNGLVDPTLIGVDANGNIVPTTVTNRFKNGKKSNWIDVSFNPLYKSQIVGKSGKIRTTTNHKFFKEDMTEVPAGELTTNDKLLMQTTLLDDSGIHYINSAMLGDGYIGTKGHYSFTECHTVDKDDYNFYIKSLFPHEIVTDRVQTSGYGSQVRHIKVNTSYNLKKLRSMWYSEDGEKQLPEDISWIDDFSIAKWYIDDGSLAHNDSQNDRALFATNAFNEQDTRRLATKLEEMYNVTTNVYFSKGWCIRINYNKNTIDTFWKAIAPHIHDSFLYKLPVEHRDRQFTPYPKMSLKRELIPVAVTDVSSIIDPTKSNFPKGRVGYDIETTTHNYFCGGVLVHNSSMTCYKTLTQPSLFDRIKSFFGFSVPTHHFGVCSRNLELSREANQVTTFNNQGKLSEYNQSDFWKTAIKLDIENKLPKGYAVQGELIGPKIQANHEKVTALDYFIFDVFDIEAGMYLLPKERQEFCKQYNLQHVPITNKNFKPLSLTLEELLKHVDTESMNPNTVSEGRVYKSLTSQLSFKVINNKYLLKCEN